jgi:hypothetical protein
MEEHKLEQMMFGTSEILYLVATLGLPYSIMLGDPFRGYSKDNLKVELEKGKKALEDKHLLLKKTLRDYDIDGRILGLFQLIQHAQYSLLINVFKTPGEISQLLYYFYQGQCLMMTLEGRYYRIFMYQNEKSMINYLMPLLGVLRQISQGYQPVKLPLAQFSTCLLSAWKNPEDALPRLTTAGLTEDDAKASLEVLIGANSASILLLQPRADKNIPQKVGYLISGSKCLWWGEPKSEQPGMLTMQPMVYSYTAITKAPEYFEDVIVFDPNTPNITTNITSLVRGGEEINRTSARDSEIIS